MQVFAITLFWELPMRLTDNFGLYIRSMCMKYIGCTGCPLTGGVTTFIGDSTIICETGRNKREQRTGNDGDNANQTADAESQK